MHVEWNWIIARLHAEYCYLAVTSKCFHSLWFHTWRRTFWGRIKIRRGADFLEGIVHLAFFLFAAAQNTNRRETRLGFGPFSHFEDYSSLLFCRKSLLKWFYDLPTVWWSLGNINTWLWLDKDCLCCQLSDGDGGWGDVVGLIGMKSHNLYTNHLSTNLFYEGRHFSLPEQIAPRLKAINQTTLWRQTLLLCSALTQGSVSQFLPFTIKVVDI